MKVLLLRINGQWIDVVQHENTNVPEFPSDKTYPKEMLDVIKDNFKKIKEASFYLPMCLESIIEDPALIQDVFCNVKLESEYAREYVVSSALECYMEKRKQGLDLDAVSFVKTLEFLYSLEEKEQVIGETICTLFKFLLDEDYFNFIQLHYYGYGYPELDDHVKYAIDSACDKFIDGRNIYFPNLIECARNIAFHDKHHPEEYIFATDLELQYYTSSMIKKYGSDLENAPDDVCERFKICMDELCEIEDCCGLEYVGKKAISGGNRVVAKDEKLGEQYLLSLIENTECEEFANAKVSCELLGDLYSRDSSVGAADYDKAYKYYSMASTLGSYKADYKIFKLSLKNLIPHAPITLFYTYLRNFKTRLKETYYSIGAEAFATAANILVCLGDERVEKGNTLACACYESKRNEYFLEALKYYLEAQKQISILLDKDFDISIVELNLELEEKIAYVQKELLDKCQNQKISFKSSELLDRFNHIPDFREESQEPFVFSYNQYTHEIKIYTETREYDRLDDVYKFLCTVPECGFCDYVGELYLHTDKLNIDDTMEVYIDGELIEFKFDSIKGNNFIFCDEVVATIDSVFTFDAKVQTAKCIEDKEEQLKLKQERENTLSDDDDDDDGYCCG